MSWDDVAEGVLDRTQEAFGKELVLYTPPGGETVELRNVPFRSAHQGVDTETGLSVLVTRPELSVKLADLPGGAAEPDALVELEDGRTFRVEAAEPDGEGGALLHLHEVTE